MPRKQIIFDIDTNVAKQILGSSYSSIYDKIRRHLQNNDFEHIEGSSYVSKKNITNQDVVFALVQLQQKYPYITQCFRDIRQADVSNIYNIKPYIINTPNNNINSYSVTNSKIKHKQLIFDIDTNIAKTFYGNNYNNVYDMIKNHLLNNNFVHIQGSSYESVIPYSSQLVLTTLRNLFNAQPNIPTVIRDIRLADISRTHILNHMFTYDRTPGIYKDYFKQIQNQDTLELLKDITTDMKDYYNQDVISEFPHDVKEEFVVDNQNINLDIEEEDLSY